MHVGGDKCVFVRRDTEYELLLLFVAINCVMTVSECGSGMRADDPEEEGELHALSEFPCSAMLAHEHPLATDNCIFQTHTARMHVCVCEFLYHVRVCVFI